MHFLTAFRTTEQFILEQTSLSHYSVQMDLKELPKTELHRHLELSLRHSTIKELAPNIGIEVPNQESFAKHFLITDPMKDLGSVLNKFLDTQKLLSSEEIIERISFEACEDAYKLEGIRLLELRYAPTFLVMGHDLTFEQAHQAVVRGVQRAEKTYPIVVGLMCIIQRTLPVAEAEAVTQFAIDNKDTFIGLDLADNEVGFDSKPFSPFFLRAKEAGMGISVHSGESNVPKAPRYVRDAIDYLGAERIGHGVQIYKDPEMIKYVIEKDVCLELCPTSNWLTSAVPTIKDHPFKILLDAGVPLCLCSDDPGIFNIDLVHQYKLMQSELGITIDEFKKCNQTAFRKSFISDEKKQRVAEFFI